MDLRIAKKEDLSQLLLLYTHLHTNAMPELDEKLAMVWDRILADRNHHILVGIADGTLVSSCVMIVIPNLTHRQRPYALIENVVTHEQFRNRGYATQLLHFAREIGIRHGCYKIMLMTGSKLESTYRFYEKAGYRRGEKTAFIQWLE